MAGPHLPPDRDFQRCQALLRIFRGAFCKEWRLISKGASILEIQERARVAGYQSLRYDGLKKVLRGLTTIEEIDRVTLVEEE